VVVVVVVIKKVMNKIKYITFRIKSSVLVMTLALHIAPLSKPLMNLIKHITPSFAYVSKFTVASAALMGGYDTVSGASTEITSPSTAKGKVGENFVYRITTAPRSARVFMASPLPDGLKMGTGSLKSYITGKPTAPGVTNVRLTASKPGYGIVYKNISIVIEASGVPPEINSLKPDSITIYEKQNASFSVQASGTPPLTYQWMLNGIELPGENASSINLKNVNEAQAGQYSVKIENPFGNLTSGNYLLNVKLLAPAPKFTSISKSNGLINLKLDTVRGRIYKIESTESLVKSKWSIVRTITGKGVNEVIQINDLSSNQKYFRIILAD
jgi:hypothetical protein